MQNKFHKIILLQCKPLKIYFAFPIYFANYLLLFAIKIKFFEQTDNNIWSFDHKKRILCYANLVLGIGTWQFDHINRMITLSVNTLSGFHCISLYLIINFIPKFFLFKYRFFIRFQVLTPHGITRIRPTLIFVITLLSNLPLFCSSSGGFSCQYYSAVKCLSAAESSFTS